VTARNRVAPTGEIVAADLRCTWMGNRGCLHRGTEIVRPWRSRAWITCVTDFKGRVMPQWAEGRYTVLFLHDEAVALAAGHRPCAECRRPAFDAFAAAWGRAHGAAAPPRAGEMDARLHQDRLDGTSQRTHARPWPDLPDGVFVATATGPALVWARRLHPWAAGYRAPRPRPVDGDATVLTPRCTVEVIAAGYRPHVALDS
jgi:hypothetical protein